MPVEVGTADAKVVQHGVGEHDGLLADEGDAAAQREDVPGGQGAFLEGDGAGGWSFETC
ncbi:hypothetical protein [Streptomyces sp. CdTB01]|uniref:hypothetical protein n=1 Tax=Streptomyces sp. CdTB01 TaxID=1725411 RepID=UPI00131ED88A|nr:hypothetical protein [Streptomyces sp. CdTB01]